MLADTSISFINDATRLPRPRLKRVLRNGIDHGTFAEVIRKVYEEISSPATSENSQEAI